MAELVLRQHGGIATADALTEAGLSRQWIRRRVSAGTFREPLPGVIDGRHAADDPSSLWIPALLYAGPGARLSHDTAATALGLLPVRASDTVHVTVLHGRRRTAPDWLVIHQDRYGAPTTTVGGLPVTTAAVTVVDMALRLPLNDFRCLAAEVVFRKLARPSDIAHAKRPPRAALRILRTVLEELHAGALSGPEAAAWRTIAEARMPLPQLNVPVETVHGLRIVDGLWSCLMLGYEIDGRSVHAQKQAFESDRFRNNDIQATGLVLMHFAASTVFGAPDVMVDTVRRFMIARADMFGVHIPALA